MFIRKNAWAIGVAALLLLFPAASFSAELLDELARIPEYAEQVVVDGNKAFFAYVDINSSVHVYSVGISATGAPGKAELFETITSATFGSLAVYDGRLYFIYQENGLSPTLRVYYTSTCDFIAEYDINADQSVSVYGHYMIASDGFLYIPSGSIGIRIFDIRNPKNIIEADLYSNGTPIIDVAIDNYTLYAIASEGNELLVLDASNPYVLKPVTSLMGISGEGLDVQDNVLITAVGNSISIFDVTYPAYPTYKSTYTGSVVSDSGSLGTKVLINGSYAYATYGGVDVFDITDYTDPTLVASRKTSGCSNTIALHGDQLLLADCANGVRVLDISSYGGTSDAAAYTYYVPYASTLDGDWTGIALSNLNNDTATTVSFTFHANDGSTLARETHILPAQGQTSFNPDLPDDSEGWLLVESTQKIWGLGLVGSDISLFDMDFADSLATTLVLPHLASAAGSWVSTAMLCNPSATAAAVTIRYYDISGAEPYAAYSFTLPALGSAQLDLASAFGGSLLGGSVEITSSMGVAGFMVYDGSQAGKPWKAGLSAFQRE